MSKKYMAWPALVLGLSACLGLSAPAAAHQLWIEQDASGARLFVGEFGDNLRETAPGMLDKFVQPSARLLSPKGERAAAVAKGPQSLGLDLKAGAGESLVAQELGFPGWERKQGDKVERHVWLPAARWVNDLGAQSPVLPLDLVPTGKAGEFQVFFDSKPLAKAKVAVVAASGWARELYTDEGGRFSVSLPWKSAYALEVQHTDKRGGNRQGQAYDVGLHVTTLSFALAQGLESPPQPPAVNGAH